MIATRFAAAVMLALALSATWGCGGGYVAVDGYDGEYVDDAPVAIETYPRYEFRDGYVYNVDGTWYHHHGAYWVRYREAPREFRVRTARHDR